MARLFECKSLLESELDLEPNIYEEQDIRNIMLGYYPDTNYLKHYMELIINEMSIEEIVRILNNRKAQAVKEYEVM